MASIVGICGFRIVIRYLAERGHGRGGNRHLYGDRGDGSGGRGCGWVGGGEREGGGVARKDWELGLEEEGGLNGPTSRSKAVCHCETRHL